jgi:hypothetical protein
VKRHLARPFELKAADDKGYFEGYGSIFGNLDSHDDIVVKGAFTRSLAMHAGKKSMPAMLWQHDPSQPIGVWDNMNEDDVGLFVKGHLVLDSTGGRDAYALLKAGALRGLSIGYQTVKSSWDEQSGIRSLLDVDLWECSPVTFPSNTESLVEDVKSAIATPSEFERLLRDAGLSRSQAKALMAGGYKALVSPRDADEDAAAQVEIREALEKLTQLIAGAQ